MVQRVVRQSSERTPIDACHVSDTKQQPELQLAATGLSFVGGLICARFHHTATRIMPLTRREFLIDSASTTLFASSLTTRSDGSAFPFRHGVASGDPLTDRVILWTRLTLPEGTLSASCQWYVATDPTMQNVVQYGQLFTSASRDFTVKVDVEGLQPGTTYYYVFEAAGQRSDIGRTRTLPEGSVDRLRIAYTSCSNITRGHFNVYKELAMRADLDVVLHLGDYIYEYADIDHCLRTGRPNAPLHETQTLEDYRLRHACYKGDKDLQEVHRQHPFMVIWDDHEVANNAWKGGADNHEEGEGSWKERLSGAVRAYLEWMPIREPSQPERGIYRSFRFGDLVDLTMLDTRLAGRHAQAETLEERNQASRSILGNQQEEWLKQCFQASAQSSVTWNLTGQQVMVAQLGTNDMPFNYDQWDGYPAARHRLFESVREAGLQNWVVLTGDIHSSWALELHDNPFADNTGKPLGVELVTPAVTSPGIDNQTRADIAAGSLEAVLPHLNFVDFYYRGYVLLDITHERLQAEWWIVDNIDSHRYAPGCLRKLSVESGTHQLKPAAETVEKLPSAPLAPAFSDDLAILRRWRRDGFGTVDGMLASSSAN